MNENDIKNKANRFNVDFDNNKLENTFKVINLLEQFKNENKNYYINFGGRKLYALLDDKNSVALKTSFKQYEDLVKDTAKESDNQYLYLDRAIEALDRYKKAGENFYVIFKGQKLYAMLDDKDSCYLKVTGKNYEEYSHSPEAINKAKELERIHRQLEALEKVPDWISKGNNLIYPQQKKDWDKFVKESVDRGYPMPDIDNVLEIMESLAKDGDMNHAYEHFKYAEDLTKNAKSPVLEAVANFSKLGTNFFKFACEKEGLKLGEKWEKSLNEIDNKFANYEKNIKEDFDESEM